MPIRRYDAAGAPVFITQVVSNRRPIFADSSVRDLLLLTLRTVKLLHPFTMHAYVLLYDHFHLLIRPEPPETIVTVVHSLKPAFTKAYRKLDAVNPREPVWQERFWDHIIRDQEDLNRHVDYIHYNPVKHGLVNDPQLWLYSTFGEWQRRGYYQPGWGLALPDSLEDFSAKEAGE